MARRHGDRRHRHLRPAAHGTYRLPPEHAASLTTPSGKDNLALFLRYIGLMGRVEDGVVEAFRSGGGVGYSGFPDLQRLQAEENGPFYDACLLERIVPLAAGLAERLDAGIDVLDISRGQGHAVNLLAGAFWGRGEGRRRGRPQPLSRRLSGVRFAPADQRGGARRTIWAGC